MVKEKLQVFTYYALDCRDSYALDICDQNLQDTQGGNAKFAWKSMLLHVAAAAKL